MARQYVTVALLLIVAMTGCQTGNDITPQKPPPRLAGPEERGNSPDNSKEWLIGKWEWRAKWKHHLRFLNLESLSGLRVYPYMDFNAKSVRIGEAYIPAEFVTREANGSEAVLDGALPVLMKQDSFFAGLNSGWLFSYQHWQTNGNHWMSLKYLSERGDGELSIVLEKASDDPGQPIHRSNLFLFHFYSENPEKHEMEYRQRKGLK